MGITFKKAVGHFMTITRHRNIVIAHSKKAGILWQGLLHDLSKYSPSEFWVGARYYHGDKSPNEEERQLFGYSSAWLHHKGRNKHHYEYWIDYSTKDIAGVMAPAKMPVKYVAEMFMDRVAACKIYNGKAYTPADPLKYYEFGKEKAPIHPETKELLERLLEMLAKEGEEVTYSYIKNNLLRKEK
mgnify:CR=1 FL=1